MTAAALIAFLMPTIEAFTLVVSAHMPLSMVMATIMTFTVMMAVVIAFGVGIILQCPFGQGLRGRVCRACHATIKSDSRLGQRVLCTHANSATDQGIRLSCFQKTGQGAVAAAVGRDDLFGDNLSVLHIIELELFCVTKMLEDFTFLISYRDSHAPCSFLRYMRCSLVAEAVVSSSDHESFAIRQCLRNFTSGAFVDSCYSGTGYSHPFSTLLLRKTFAIQQTDCFKLVQTHHNRFGICYLFR